MPARFIIDPALATLLGESYRSSEYAIKELVDNAWDADATEVRIELPEPMTSDPIIIRDNGSGMTDREVLTEYLRVASGRRTRKGERTPLKNRLVKGRKGIGKFAGLLAADIMVVETKARGIATRLKLEKEQLIEAQKSQADLEGVDLNYTTTECDPFKTGTTITLFELNQHLSFPRAERLKQLLVLEYGRKLDFKIYVNGDLLDVEDIPGKTFTEEIELPDVGKVRFKFTISDGNLKQSGIAVRVQDKIVGKPSYFGLDEDEEIPGKLLRKIYGEVEADGLADDVTADWGAIIENSKAFQSMTQWASLELKDRVGDVFRQEVQLQRARHQRQINERLAQLPEYRREFAKLALEKVMHRFYGENDEK